MTTLPVADIVSQLDAAHEPPDMTCSSSPVQYPPSSSPAPAPVKQKRKLFQSFTAGPGPVKKPRIDAIVELESSDQISIAEHVPRESRGRDDFIRLQFENDVDQEDVTTTASDYDGSLAPTGALAGCKPSVSPISLKTCSGKTISIAPRKKHAVQTYEQLIAERSVQVEGRARKAYYGVEIHRLVDEAKNQQILDRAAKEVDSTKEPHQKPAQERHVSAETSIAGKHTQNQMWTEKYRAKKFTDLVGDERTHRSVLKWLKAWDPIVFPGNVKQKPKRIFEDNTAESEYQHRKILLLTGPPGLGKTTLAHVCAKQAGYEVLEINASDDRTKDVVKGRIKDALGTETVRGIHDGKSRKAGRPVCVVVDEVDGVVSGSNAAGGEGGFTKALIDLVQLDQKNSHRSDTAASGNTKQKGDRFRLLRPLILICNDVYAPSLRPLRTSSLAEIIHIRKPPLDKVIARLKTVFEQENIRHDNDAIRRLCETAWGLGTRKQNTVGARGTGDGDIRGVLVQSEWMVHKLRATPHQELRLTRKWVEAQTSDLSSNKGNGNFARGGIREVVERVFIEGAGLAHHSTTLSAEETHLLQQSSTKPLGVSDLRKRTAIAALREMIDTTGDHDRLVTDCFATYPTQVYQDDTFLSKPNSTYEWLHFHDCLSSRVFSGQEFELSPYLSTSACAFHDLFAGVDNGTTSHQLSSKDILDTDNEVEAHPFTGLKADFAAYEAQKVSQTHLSEFQSNFSASLLRSFSHPSTIATELVPNLTRILAPNVKPVIVNGGSTGFSVASVRKESERTCINTSVRAMHALGISFEKVRIESEGYGNATYAYRMEPPIDDLGTFWFDKATNATASATTSTAQPVRYAVRQVLDQELRKLKIQFNSQARAARGSGAPTSSNTASNAHDDDKENQQPLTVAEKPLVVKRDFFGRPLSVESIAAPSKKIDAEGLAKATATKGKAEGTGDGDGRTWVSFHEGFSNAVRKPITLKDLLDGF